MMLVSSLLCLPNFASGDSLNTHGKLILPIERVFQLKKAETNSYLLKGSPSKEKAYIAYSVTDGKVIAQIYAYYLTFYQTQLKLRHNIQDLEYDVALLSSKTSSYERSLDQCDLTLQSVNRDRLTLNQVVKSEREAYKKATRKNKLHKILIGTGSGLAGIGLGLLLGIFLL